MEDQTTDSARTPLDQAIKLLDGQASMARKLGVTPGLVSQWVKRTRDPLGKAGRPLPAHQAATIESLCDRKVTARQLLPDFPWPQPAQAEAA